MSFIYALYVLLITFWYNHVIGKIHLLVVILFCEFLHDDSQQIVNARYNNKRYKDYKHY